MNSDDNKNEEKAQSVEDVEQDVEQTIDEVEMQPIDEGDTSDVAAEQPAKGSYTGGDVITSDSAAVSTEFSYLTALSSRENIVDLDTIKDTVWFTFPDWRRRVSGFMLLLILASVIASSGIVSDSTATVIGAMIVAPLMTPIQGTMLGVVLSDFRNFMVSTAFVMVGIVCAVGMGYLFALFVDEESVLPENNSQVAGRIAPKLLDLVGAFATGAVAAIALIRSDIAGSLPGVSIAISLVPPLNVVGVCLKIGYWAEAGGAFLLFVTNYVCILVVGIMVMFSYRVHRMARQRKYHLAQFGAWLYQKMALLIILALLVIVGGLLYYSSNVSRETIDIQKCLQNDELYPIEGWNSGGTIESGAWTVSSAKAKRPFGTSDWSAVVAFTGKPPFPEMGNMSTVAETCGVNKIDLLFVPAYKYDNLLNKQ